MGTDPILGQGWDRWPQADQCQSRTVASLPTFRDGYKRRRCIVPVDNFFEWKAIKGQKTKQPYAIAMKSGEPFALAAIWENWKVPHTEESMRTFCILTTAANDLVGQIRDRMPVILPPAAYDRWLATSSPIRVILWCHSRQS